MSGTTKQKAVHQIRLGKPKAHGQGNIVNPGEVFDCPNSDLEWLQEQGACVDVDEPELAQAASDDEEAERQKLLAKAKDLGIKGIRKDLNVDTLREKIAEHEAAQGGDDDGDDDGSDEDVVG